MFHGIDTETHKGYARCICVENHKPFFDREFSKPSPQIQEYILQSPNRLASWNLRFDAQSILKHYPEEIVKRLLYVGSVEWKTGIIRNQISLIPWKLIEFKRLHLEKNRWRSSHITTIYDAMQFYHSSLQKASQTVLGESKTEDSNFAESLNTTLHHWKNSPERIIQYCQDDAIKAGKLMRKFLGAMAQEPIYLEPRSPISCARFAKEFVEQTIPDWKLKAVSVSGNRVFNRPWKRFDNVTLQAYIGGRFEALKKGTFENVYNLDINSAYPHFIAQLPNPFKCQIIQDVEPGGFMAIVKAEINVPRYLNHGPLPYRHPSGVITFPVGVWTGWFHWHELQNAAEKFGVEYTIYKTLNLYETEKERPFQKRLHELYDKRLEWKKDGDPRQLAAKIAMNSIYGIFLETIPRISESDSRRATEINGHHVQKHKDIPGKFLHPFFGGWITSKTRVMLLNATNPETIFMATDGILTPKKPVITSSKNMGDWSIKKYESAVVYGNGIYSLDGELKTRGFRGHGRDADNRPINNRIISKEGSLFVDCIEKGPMHLPAVFNSPSHSLKDALVWIEKVKQINISKDEKRDWEPFTKQDLLSRPINSKPIQIFDGDNPNPKLIHHALNQGINYRHILSLVT